MKITIVSETFPPDQNPLAMHYWHLAKALIAKQHQVHIIHPRPKYPTARDITTRIAPTTLVKGYSLRKTPDLQYGQESAGKLRKLWRDDKPDAIIVGTEGPLGHNAQKAALSLGIPVVSCFQAYGKKLDFNKLRGADFNKLKKFHRKSHCCLVGNTELQTLLKDKGFENLKHIPQATDVDTFNQQQRSQTLRDKWGLEENDIALIHHSDFTSKPELDAAMQVFQKVRQTEPSSKCVIIGDGPLYKKAFKNFQSYVFTGDLDEQDCAQAYASGDILISTNTHDPLSTVVTNAIASGLLIMGYQYGLLKDRVDNAENGFTAKPNNLEGLLNSVENLMNSSPLWPIMTETTLRRSQQFDFTHMADQIESIIT